MDQRILSIRAMNWIPSPKAHWVTIDGHIVVLDLASGNYIGLTDHTATQWLRLTSPTGDQAEETPEGEVECSRGEDNGLSSLQALGLVVEVAHVEESAQHKDDPRAGTGITQLPLHLDALASVYSTSRVIRNGGIDALHSLLQLECSRGRRTRRTLAETVRAFQLIEPLTSLAFGKDDCLLRSSALSRLLWRQGHVAKHVIGVRLHPFAAHAWVEAKGRPLLEDESMIDQFHPLLVTER